MGEPERKDPLITQEPKLIPSTQVPIVLLAEQGTKTLPEPHESKLSPEVQEPKPLPSTQGPETLPTAQEPPVVPTAQESKTSAVHFETKADPKVAKDISTEDEAKAVPEEGDDPFTPHYWRNPFARKHSGIEGIDDYYANPRDLTKHSKWPIFLRMHGSIIPEMVLPLLWQASWATTITCVSKFIFPLGITNVLLTVMGFVVSLGLSTRSSTAYERYSEGRKYWTQLSLATHNLTRAIWLHTVEREGDEGKQDLLSKMTAMNLLTAFAISLMHRLRFEPYIHHEDLEGLIGHLDTYARSATDDASRLPRQAGFFKRVGMRLGVSFAHSNPRSLIKESKQPLGNLPLEILSYLAVWIDDTITDQKLKISGTQNILFQNLLSLNDVLTGTERIANTPLPAAYSIAIAQMTWVYISILPFQLYNYLGWITIPGSIVGAYMILNLLLIGSQLENPFGNDVNDLPLEIFCQQIANEIDIISSIKRPKPREWINKDENQVMFPVSTSGYSAWEAKSVKRLRAEWRNKIKLGFETRKRLHAERVGNKRLRKWGEV